MVIDSRTESEQMDVSDPPELSPVWGLTLLLAEIAERIERDRRTETQEQNDDME